MCTFIHTCMCNLLYSHIHTYTRCKIAFAYSVSLISAPSSPPDRFNISKLTDNMAVLEWGLPMGHSESVGIWYLVEVTENGIANTSQVDCMNVTIPLTPATMYCVRVLGAVSGGYSPWSGEVCFSGPGTYIIDTSFCVHVGGSIRVCVCMHICLRRASMYVHTYMCKYDIVCLSDLFIKEHVTCL